MTDTKAVEILLVEDTDADAELALHALRKNNLSYRIHRVHDGEEALDFLFCRAGYAERRFDNAPRLVLLDLKLPKVDGLQVLGKIKSDPRTKAIPVIILTSSREERDVAMGYRSGVNSYIQKPVNFTDFQDAVRQLGVYWMATNTKPPASAFAGA